MMLLHVYKSNTVCNPACIFGHITRMLEFICFYFISGRLKKIYVTCFMIMTENRVASLRKKSGRPLGFAETTDQLFIMKYDCGVYWQIGVLHSSEPLQERHVEAALKILARKQEALQLRIVFPDANQTTAPEFRFAPMADPEKLDFLSIRIKCKDDWPETIAHDHDKNKIDYANGPLWRFILCRVEAGKEQCDGDHDYVFLFKISHVIADGKSVTDLFYRQFLPLLSATTNGHDAENLFPFVPQPKCVEELFLSKKRFKNPVPWYFKLGLNILRWKNRTFKPPEIPVLMFPDDDLPSNVGLNKEPVCVPKIFRPDICEPVVKAAKRNGITVHPVLLVAGAMALSRTAEAAKVKLPESIKQVWPIDLRGFLHYQTPQPLGDIRAGGFTSHKTISVCTMENFWHTCQKVYLSVKTGTKEDKCTPFLGLAKYMADEISESDFDTVFKEMGINPYISLSNLGNVSGGQAPTMTDGPVQIRMTEQFFTLSGVAGITFVPICQMIMTYEGRIMWNIIHSPTKVSQIFVNKYYENLADILKTYCVQKLEH